MVGFKKGTQALKLTPPDASQSSSADTQSVQKPDFGRVELPKMAIPHETWRTPIDGHKWKSTERSLFNVYLSPPQREALDLIVRATGKAKVATVAEILEQALLDQLKELTDPAIAGVAMANEAADTLHYLSKWGDLTVGRTKPGRRGYED
jgi:hypothetical protein